MANREVLDAYQVARWQALRTGTVRLRFHERRARRHVDRLSQTDMARLAAIREELRDRGFDLPDLPAAGWAR